MRINKKCKLEKIVLNKLECGRETLKMPYYRDGYVYATNAIVIAKVAPDKVRTEPAESEGHIDIGELKQSRKTNGIPEVGAHLDPHIGKPPDFEAILNFPKEPVYEIKLNAKFLYDLAQALGDNAVTLRFQKKPMAPVEIVGKYGIGAIMPIRMDK